MSILPPKRLDELRILNRELEIEEEIANEAANEWCEWAQRENANDSCNWQLSALRCAIAASCSIRACCVRARKVWTESEIMSYEAAIKRLKDRSD